MPKSLIFKDRSKLLPYYIPEKLPQKDSQIRLLTSLYGEIVDNTRSAHPRVGFEYVCEYGDAKIFMRRKASFR